MGARLILVIALASWAGRAVAAEPGVADSIPQPSIPSSASADSVPSPVAAPADSAPPAVAAPADSLGRAAWLIISLDHDQVLTAAKVEPSTLDFIHVITVDGKSSYIAAYRVRSIRGLDGTDHTSDVLDRHRSVGALDGVAVIHTHHDFAFRGHPLPETKTFLITHVGIGARVDPGKQAFYPRTDYYGMGDLGLMHNVSRHVAVGGNFYLGVDDRRTRFGPKARVRYWLYRTISFDVAPGILLGGDDDWQGHTEFPGFVGEASLGVGDVVQVTGEVESVSIEDQTGAKATDTSVYLGAKVGTPESLGTFAGLIAAVIGTMFVIALLSY